MTAYTKDHSHLPGATLFSMPFQSGRFYFLPNWTAVSTNGGLGNNTARATPFWVPNLCTFSEVDAEVTTGGQAGATYRIAFYADDGTGRPGTLLLEAGSIAADTTGVKALTISQEFTPGAWWVAGVVQNAGTTQPTMRTVNGLGIAPNIDAGTSTPSAGAAAIGRTATVSGAFPGTWVDTGTAGTVARFIAKIT